MRMVIESLSRERKQRMRVPLNCSHATALVIGAFLFFATSGLCNDTAALTRFVELLPKQPRGVLVAAGTPSSLGIHKKLPVNVELKEEGYLAALYVFADGSVTFIASPRRVAAGVASIWALWGLEPPETAGPEGYDLLVILLDPSTPWTTTVELESQELKAGAAQIPPLLDRIAARVAGNAASATLHVLEILEDEGAQEGARALKNKKPTIPVWLAGVRG